MAVFEDSVPTNNSLIIDLPIIYIYICKFDGCVPLLGHALYNDDVMTMTHMSCLDRGTYSNHQNERCSELEGAFVQL